jgi:hypothetical protein
MQRSFRVHGNSRLQVDRESVTAEELAALDVDLERDFPGSSAEDFRRYPVLSEGGWHIVVKHQPSLRSVSRVPWSLLGPIELTSAALDLD